jgi:putative effector of murein hydrolase LrgA (UPF0299 family)
MSFGTYYTDSTETDLFLLHIFLVEIIAFKDYKAYNGGLIQELGFLFLPRTTSIPLAVAYLGR